MHACMYACIYKAQGLNVRSRWWPTPSATPLTAYFVLALLLIECQLVATMCRQPRVHLVPEASKACQMGSLLSGRRCDCLAATVCQRLPDMRRTHAVRSCACNWLGMTQNWREGVTVKPCSCLCVHAYMLASCLH